MIYNPSHKKIFLLVGLIVFVVALIAVVFLNVYNKSKSQRNADYVIPNVPYIGLHNQANLPANTRGDISAAAISILEYWNPGQANYAETNRYFAPKSREDKFAGLGLVQKFFEKDGKYSAKIERLAVDELGKYVNENTRTPLFLFLAIDGNQPAEIRYYPAKVLIGVSYSARKLIFHDVFLGNNMEISFDDYEKLWECMRPDSRNFYLAVQPVDLKNKLKEVKSKNIIPYEKRGQVVEKSQQMFKNMAMGIAALNIGLPDMSIDYLQKVTADNNYEGFFPPFFKVQTLYELAVAYSKKDQLETALEYANKAVSLNYDLDKPFKDWLGYPMRRNDQQHTGQIDIAYRVLGDIYNKTGDLTKAAENYSKALEVDPDNKLARERLDVINKQ